MSDEVCVYCEKPIRFRDEYGDFVHADGWVRCYGGSSTRAMPRREEEK